MTVRIGVDLGGSKIEGVALTADGEERGRRRAPTPKDDYEGTLAAVKAVVLALEREHGLAPGPIGVGAPGSLSPSRGVMRNANATWLNGRPLDRDLAAVLARPVRLANDANCFALSEALDGAGRGAGTVFGVILGTGVGGGLVVNGALLSGANAIAGEWGHTRLPEPTDAERPGPPCFCGARGCVETWISGPALERDYALAQTGRPQGGERECAEGARVPAAAIATAAAEGEPAAQAALDRHLDRLARAMTPVLNIFDPDRVVLGGGLSLLPALPENLSRALASRIFSDSFRTEVRRAEFGDSSGVRGAARLWPL